MEKEYYKKMRDSLIEKLEYINNEEHKQFFKKDIHFLLSIYLTYFCLIEDTIIRSTKSDRVISTRFKKFIGDSLLSTLTSKNIPIDIIKQDEGTNNEWLISTIRNGIVHKGIEFDEENQTIKVINNEELNVIECNIPIEWFKTFIELNVGYMVELDKFTYHHFTAPPVQRDFKPIQTDDDIDEYISKEMNSIIIDIEYDETSDSKDKLNRREFILITNELSKIFYEMFYCRRPQDNDFETLKRNKETELINEKATLSTKEYNKLLYFNMFKEYYTNRFRIIYPNYKVEIKDFKKDNYAKDLFKDPFRKRYFFTHEKTHMKPKRLSHRLRERYNHDKIENTYLIYDLYKIYIAGICAANRKELEHLMRERYHEMITAILYILGLNIYVMNKEQHFEEIDYSFMDSLDIKGYKFTKSLEDLTKKKKRLNRERKALETNLTQLNEVYSKDMTNERLKNLIDKKNEELTEKSAEIEEVTNNINNLEPIQIEGKRVVKESNADCATSIRNCFAHGNRVHVYGEFEDDLRVTLTDYKDTGEISGVIYTNLSSIIKFLKHEIFKNQIMEEPPKTLTKNIKE